MSLKCSLGFGKVGENFGNV